MLLRSSIIDDWGRDHVFEFDLPNGTYNVTVGVGYRGGTRPHTILIEGTTFINNETTNNSAIIRTKTVTVKDKKLTLVMGMYDQTGHINFLDIEAAYVPPAAVTDLRVTNALTDTSTLTATLRWTPLSSAITTTLRYLNAPITDLNWNSALTLTSSVDRQQLHGDRAILRRRDVLRAEITGCHGRMVGVIEQRLLALTGRLPAADPEVRMIHLKQNRILRLPSGRAF